MRAKTVLDTIRVASPCQAAWGGMKGDDRVRACSLCQKRVYNLSAMSAADALALVQEAEGGLCVRFYRRRDGTMLTADCPEGRKTARRGLVRRLATSACMGLAVIAGAAVARGGSGPGWQPHLVPPPSGPGTTPRDWSDWALEVLDIRPRPVAIMGAMYVPIALPPSPVSMGEETEDPAP